MCSSAEVVRGRHELTGSPRLRGVQVGDVDEFGVRLEVSMRVRLR
jgi:hypothetical protein